MRSSRSDLDPKRSPCFSTRDVLFGGKNHIREGAELVHDSSDVGNDKSEEHFNENVRSVGTKEAKHDV